MCFQVRTCGLSSSRLLLPCICNWLAFEEQDREHPGHNLTVRYGVSEANSGWLNYRDCCTFRFISKSSDLGLALMMLLLLASPGSLSGGRKNSPLALPHGPMRKAFISKTRREYKSSSKEVHLSTPAAVCHWGQAAAAQHPHSLRLWHRSSMQTIVTTAKMATALPFGAPRGATDHCSSA